MYPVGDASLPVSVDTHFPFRNPERGIVLHSAAAFRDFEPGTSLDTTFDCSRSIGSSSNRTSGNMVSRSAHENFSHWKSILSNTKNSDLRIYNDARYAIYNNLTNSDHATEGSYGGKFHCPLRAFQGRFLYMPHLLRFIY
jgi:hypothetical protein